MITLARLKHIRHLFDANVGAGIYGIQKAELLEVFDMHIESHPGDPVTEPERLEPSESQPAAKPAPALAPARRSRKG